MANKQFRLPHISPLIGSTLRAFKNTLKGNTIDPQFRAKKNITLALIYLLSPLRWYERAFVLPRARKKTPKEVVFILGHWRGGTTFLHNLMCQAENASYVTTFQTSLPNFMGSKRLLGPLMKMVMPGKRPSDNVKLAVDFPQEEEFALSGINEHSYYGYMYFPKKYQTYYDESTSLKGLTEIEKRTFARDYKDIMHKALLNKPGELLIVKNPINTARIKFLYEQYPNAKWIHLYRNPYTVYRSSIKFFTELLPTLWFEGVTEEFIKEMVLEIYVKLHQDFDSALADLPDLNLIELKFEDFEEDPLGNLEKIYETLGLKDFDKSRTRFEQYLRGQQSYQKNKYNIPPDVIELIKTHWGEYIERWGYEMPEN